ncbi:MAG TPA: hypothetical protein VHN37_06110 [Actinomycetota bacterium]|nr:hypothetical protein [Actinomycetota bacterium]
MRLRRIQAVLVLAALAIGACGGDDADTGITVEEPIGAPEPGIASAAPSVEKSARVDMEVARAQLSEAAQAVVDLATSPKVGGFLTSSVVDVQDAYGSAIVLVQVPAERFEQTVADLSRIGDVVRQEMAGEQLAEPGMKRAERAAAAAEAAYAPVDVSIRGRRPPPPPEESAIGRALGTATDISLSIAAGAIVAGGAVLPVAALLLVVYLVSTLVIRRLRIRWEQPG